MKAVWIPMLVVGVLMYVVAVSAIFLPFGRKWMATLGQAALVVGFALIMGSMVVCVSTT